VRIRFDRAARGRAARGGQYLRGMNLFVTSALLAAMFGLPNPPATTTARDSVTRSAVGSYASHVHAEYRASRESTELMRAAIRAFCAEPTEAGLGCTWESWAGLLSTY
jgi:uncharacterized iron-regulated protein